MLTLLLISVGVGFVGSLVGLGGASMLTPILVLCGVPVKEAVAAGMVAIIATSSGSASSFVKEKIANIRLAMFLEAFTIVGAIVGATITVIIAPIFLYFLFAGFLCTSFINVRSALKEEYHPPKTQDKLSKWLGLHGSYYDASKKQVVEYKSTNSILGGLGMFVAGVAGGMLGLGAGAFKVIIHEKILKVPAKVSSATSNFIIGMTALAGVSVYLFSGLLNLTLIAPMAIGVTIGASIGGRFLNRVPDRNLKVLFMVIVVLLIVQMLFKGVTSL
ncbi:MAG: sulfite exporter TauE/SafE family protein [Candidatus Bathyarchaeota archaeon]|nr:sulfite exporter TauE/SafE family protein [Candidatus Bathyarchaeota archaeon]